MYKSRNGFGRCEVGNVLPLAEVQALLGSADNEHIDLMRGYDGLKSSPA